ncbi:MAG: hypothetical protein RL660_2756 [Bacteroidota bacterium]|jgi:hypothetical protein
MFGTIFALNLFRVRTIAANIAGYSKKLVFLSACVLLSFAAHAGVLDNITACFKTGKVAVIEEHIAPNCEININGDKSAVSKIQAKLLIEGFFSKNTPSDFVITTSNTLSGSKYAVGKLTTATGKYDVYITFDAMDSNIITSIKISQ